ncbi:MAG: DUF4870 domain-containing protein [Flavobacterium sp.]|nr:DUF4870 domain-containing protein [Flavobacterium sp.]
METNSKNSTAALINLSTLTQYFIPFGNFLFPIIIWSTTRDKSEYVNEQGKQTINFQLSLFLYTFVLALIAIPIVLVTFFNNVSFNAIINNDDLFFENFDFSNMTGVITIAISAIALFIFMKIAEFFLIIYASVKTSNGDNFKYPLTIPFIK